VKLHTPVRGAPIRASTLGRTIALASVILVAPTFLSAQTGSASAHATATHNPVHTDSAGRGST
jgi:hypothetical protein